MNVAIHQPQYLPWLPYFLKIAASDVFIILDNVDFQKNGLQNRNQIKTAQGANWLTVPVRQQLGQKICDVRIDNSVDWRRKHWQTIQQCYGKAAAFSGYQKELEAFYACDWEGLSDLNIAMTTHMLRWMDIRTPTMRSSSMGVVGSASDLVLRLCLEVGGTRYLSGAGGRNYLNQAAFDQAGVEIDYRSSAEPGVYPQQFPRAGFIKHLSALDMILNCGTGWRSYLPETVIQP